MLSSEAAATTLSNVNGKAQGKVLSGKPTPQADAVGVVISLLNVLMDKQVQYKWLF